MIVESVSEDVAYVGPCLSHGPLPALFYFALSAKDSLALDPFNQPVAYLSSLPMRIFSLTLPGHENNLPATEALTRWAEGIEKGEDIIGQFVEKVRAWIDLFLAQNILIPEKMAVAGLSRGAFIATHVAAKIPLFRTLLGFAPLTQLDRAREFSALKEHPLVHSLNLKHLILPLIHSQVRFYIGNLDTRVSTRACFEWIETLCLCASQHQIRSPLAELIISPSIGRDGHGTSAAIFHQGAQWIATQLGVLHGL